MVHQYKLNGYNIVLDIYSGSVHAVDEIAYDMIAMYEHDSTIICAVFSLNLLTKTCNNAIIHLLNLFL